MESYCKILIVEDEFLLRQGIKNQLQGFFSVIGFPYDLETFLFPVHQIFYSLSEQKIIC